MKVQINLRDYSVFVFGDKDKLCTFLEKQFRVITWKGIA